MHCISSQSSITSHHAPCIFFCFSLPPPCPACCTSSPLSCFRTILPFLDLATNPPSSLPSTPHCATLLRARNCTMPYHAQPRPRLSILSLPSKANKANTRLASTRIIFRFRSIIVHHHRTLAFDHASLPVRTIQYCRRPFIQRCTTLLSVSCLLPPLPSAMLFLPLFTINLFFFWLSWSPRAFSFFSFGGIVVTSSTCQQSHPKKLSCHCSHAHLCIFFLSN